MNHLLNHVIVMILFCGMCSCQQLRSKNDKYILLWNEEDSMKNSIPISYFMNGYYAFKLYGCPVVNCYVTSNKQFFHGSMRKFDAIVFDGKALPESLSMNRFYHQKYIFASMDPASEHPVCDPNYDGFFNWTATYRLTSDFIFPFIIIKNATGQVVGPKCDMSWQQNMPEIEEKFSKALRSKTKLAAWFVANCTHKERNQFVKNLQEALKKYDLSIDIYGRCGDHKCPKSKLSECVSVLRKDYFFYLALESIHTQDYVTEKVVPALQNYVVPVVYGGADYTRFLPPGSYLNGKKLNPEALALQMKTLMDSPRLYQNFFKWRRFYRYMASAPGSLYKGNGVCQICEALHKEDINPTETVVPSLRSWWEPNFQQKCAKAEDAFRMERTGVQKGQGIQTFGILQVPKKNTFEYELEFEIPIPG